MTAQDDYMSTLITRSAHHVLESGLEVPSEGAGLVVLDFAVLDRQPFQVVIHLHRKDGRCPALILRTL